MLDDEEWRPVPGTDGLYEVSSQGRVRSWKNGKWGRGTKAHVLRPAAAKGDRQYLKVSIDRGSGRHSYAVHTLVAEAFLGSRPAGFEICHGDGDYFNNAASNLRYASRVDNAADKILHGTLPLGEEHHNAVLTEVEVLEIRSRLAAGESIRGLGRAYGVSASTISDIKLGKTWVHVTA